MKPFKPLTFVRRPDVSSGQREPILEPPAKKRRISEETPEEHIASLKAAANALKTPHPPKLFQAPVRKPLEIVQNANGSHPTPSPAHTEHTKYYTVLWRKITTKKNKTWDGDGVLVVSNGSATLQDVSGKDIGRTVCKRPLDIGTELSISGKEIEIESVLSKDEFLATRPPKKTQLPQSHLRASKSDQRLSTSATMSHPAVERPRSIPALPSRNPTNAAFKAPLMHGMAQVVPPRDGKLPSPRHDPNRPNALVMKRPRHAPKGRQIVDVVVDPLLSDKLREHQRVGVSFLYECVMGMKDYDGEGAILADEMGLGKTLQTIALLWTLMKQSPIAEEPPVIKKALIVCPVTLINNWRKEFRRWLGTERIGVMVLKDKKTKLTDFTKGRSYSVMIIGYEKVRMVQEELQQASGSGIDIVIADEGHRLKTAQNKSALAIKSLNTERRIILSGTPLQNDLGEFHTMVDFVNPGLLKKYSAFKRDFENPIVRGQQPGASPDDKEKGEARAEELATLTGKFILRRTSDILSKYLPPKTEYVLFCKPTGAQRAVYRAILESPVYSAALGSSSLTLELINILKKVCNSPNLLLKNSKDGGAMKAELMECIPQASLKSSGASGKLQVLDSLLHQMRNTTDEKVVLISNYTSTLNTLGNLLTSLSYKFLRLDGSTPASQRQDLVDRFNRSSQRDCFVFLLSAKAGGLGLNLHGASRLILFDGDWNPATDLQAMARVHREGQKRACYIYRLLTKGALDEKIFQRQVSKTGLADSIVDGKNGVSGFTREELRDLFRLDDGEGCQTHILLGCTCGGRGMPMVEPEDDAISPRNDLAALSSGGDDIDRDENGVEIVHLEDDAQPSLSSRRSWMSAKEYSSQAESEAKDPMVARAKMLSLMQYAHFDTSLVPERAAEEEMDEGDALEGVIEDAVLRSVLREKGGRVGFVLSKLSG